MLKVRCCHAARQETISVERRSQLRSLQKTLCRLFGERFPLMKACVTIDGILWDEFGDTPFEKHEPDGEDQALQCTLACATYTSRAHDTSML